MYSLKLNTEPDEEPIQLSEVKDQLRITTTDEDLFLTRLITAARKQIEVIIGRSIISQTWDLYFDSFPHANFDKLRLYKPPVQSINFIKYYDENDVEQTWDSSEYFLDSDAHVPTIYPERHFSYPSTRVFPKSVHVQFIAGYGEPSNVPEDLKQAILLMVGHLERNREATIGFNLETIPFGVQAILSPYKIFNF